jgi:ABC-type phosphate/phosphonate transport system substrate-binding protein
VIANARMYAVSPEVSGLWRELLAAVIARSRLAISLIEHAEPAPIDALWRREDKAAVFMCGLPFARTEPRPVLVAAPVPSPPEFRGIPQYWSELVVHAASPYRSIDQTFGRRIAFTVPDSQSGCLAALQYFMTSGGAFPRFQEIIAPQITPLGAVTAVLKGDAEVAPIDSYAFTLLSRYRPDLTSQLRVIARTDPTPIPAFVASPGALSPGELESLQSAFLEAHENPLTQELMERLLLQRFALPHPASYGVLRDNYEAATRYWSAHQLAAVADPAFRSLKR